MSLKGDWNSFVNGVRYDMHIDLADPSAVKGTHEDTSYVGIRPGPNLKILSGSYKFPRLQFSTASDSFDGLVLDLTPLGAAISLGRHPHKRKDEGDDSWTATKGGGGGIGDEDSPLRFNEGKKKDREKQKQS